MLKLLTTNRIFIFSKYLKSKRITTKSNYKYDFFVIGGGSGGLSAAKEAANYGVKVGIADFVRPSPLGTKWGIGGTCVNVGCIPKKMMHHAGILYDQIAEFPRVGLNNEIVKTHDWETMVQNIQMYIKVITYFN